MAKSGSNNAVNTFVTNTRKSVAAIRAAVYEQGEGLDSINRTALHSAFANFTQNLDKLHDAAAGRYEPKRRRAKSDKA